jgi:hypothetical protein
VVSAFDFNRHVTGVRYHFDDGTTLDHQLPAVPELQPLDLPDGGRTTRFVRVEILGTVRPAGADNDTVISEAVFEGVA